MASRRTPPRCTCGCTYDDMRTGLTFRDVRRMMHDQPDPNRPGWFRQKRRRGVLGYWRAIKLMMWDAIHGWCNREMAA